MAEIAIPYTLKINNLNSKSLGALTLKAIEDMTMEEFATVDNRLNEVEREVRFDTVVYEPVAITPAHIGRVFKDGIEEEAFYATDKTNTGKYTKSRRHTNMFAGGSFDKGVIAILKAISIPCAFTAGVPTTVNHGLIENPAAVINKTNYDNALQCETFTRAFDYEVWEGNKAKFRKRIDLFPALNNGVVGFQGSSPGGIAYNTNNSDLPNILTHPRIYEGGSTFHGEIHPLGNYSLVNYGVQYGLEIQYHTVEYTPIRG